MDNQVIISGSLPKFLVVHKLQQYEATALTNIFAPRVVKKKKMNPKSVDVF